MPRRVLMLVVVMLPLAVGARPAEEWPVWRGPRHDGTSTSSAFRVGPGDGLRVVWRKPLGTGFSSISIAGGRVVTLYGDGVDDFVVALNGATGDRLWRHRIGETFEAPVQSYPGPLSTPVIADGRVFALGPRGELLALDLASGKLLWSHDLVGELGAMSQYFGFATSPLVEGELVMVQAGGSAGSLLAFDTQGGALVWATGEDSVTYQSPIAVTLHGERQIVFAGDRWIHGGRPATGEILWRHEHGVRAHPDRVRQIVLGPSDLNPIGIVPVSKNRLLLTNYYSDSSVLLRVSTTDGNFVLDEMWRNDLLLKSYALPVVLGDWIYGYRGRFVTCVDLDSGELLWRIRGPGDGWVTAAGNQLLHLSKNGGTVHVGKPGAGDLQELARVEVFDAVAWTPPSLAGGRVFLRNFEHIAAVEVAPAGEDAEPSTVEPTPDTAFGRFVARVEAAPAEERPVLVDRFMAAQQSFPLIEDERWVHVLYRGEARDMEIEGDMLESGEEAVMTRLADTDLFYYTFELPRDARINYRLKKDFESVELNDPLNPRTASSWGREASEIAMPGFVPASEPDPSSVEPGRIDEHSFASEVLGNERRLAIHRPAGRGEDGARPLGLLVVTHGSAAREFGRIPETLDLLQAAGRLRPIITVFVDSPDPALEYTGELRDRHAEMLVDELLPWVAARYPVTDDPGQRAILGVASGGYAAIYTAFRFPRVFGAVAGQSSQLYGPLGGDALVALIESSPRLDTRFYLEWGLYDLRGRGVQRREGLFDWRRDNAEMAQRLRRRGHRVVESEIPQGWGWGSWRNRTDTVLEFLFGTSPPTSPPDTPR